MHFYLNPRLGCVLLWNGSLSVSEGNLAPDGTTVNYSAAYLNKLFSFVRLEAGFILLSHSSLCL